MNEEMKIIRKKPLLEIGSCNIHISHNAFLKGLQEYGSDVQDFVLDLYYFFHGWPQREEDFQMIQDQLGLPKHKFIKHVTSRWLTLSDAAQRIIEQWLAIKKYFSNFIPSKRRDLTKTKRYQSICQSLSDQTFKPRILFVISSANSFKSLNTFLQTDTPLIHALHQSLHELVNKILFKFINEKTIINYDTPEEIFKSENLLPLSKMYVGEETKKYIDETKYLSEKDKLLIYTGAQKHYMASTKHLMNKFSLKSIFLKYCKYLNPKNIIKSQTQHVTYLSEKLALNINGDELADEWRLLKGEEILLNADTLNQSIENFWNTIFAISCNIIQMPKYPNIKKLVSACLCLSHGSADVERGFSRSGHVLTEINTQMSVKTLNARLNTIELLKRFGNKPYYVPLTHELVKLCKNAHKSYIAYLEKEKQKTEEINKLNQQKQREKEMEEENKKHLEQTKKTIEELESEIQDQKKELKIRSEAADTVFSQASKQLKKCLSKNDLEGAKVAEELLHTYKQLKDVQKKKFDKLANNELKIEKRKATLLTEFLNNKKKKQ